jgi:hypothetical protein
MEPLPDIDIKLRIIAEAELVPHKIRGKISVQPYCQKAVLLVLAVYEGKPVSRMGIGARTGLSRDTIGNAFHALEARHFITADPWTRHKYRSFKVHWTKLAAAASIEPIACPPRQSRDYARGRRKRQVATVIAGVPDDF